MANPNEPVTADDIAALRQAHPGWFFTTVSAAAGACTDQRLLVAQCGAVVLSDVTAEALAAKIEREVQP